MVRENSPGVHAGVSSIPAPQVRSASVRRFRTPAHQPSGSHHASMLRRRSSMITATPTATLQRQQPLSPRTAPMGRSLSRPAASQQDPRTGVAGSPALLNLLGHGHLVLEIIVNHKSIPVSRRESMTFATLLKRPDSSLKIAGVGSNVIHPEPEKTSPRHGHLLSPM